MLQVIFIWHGGPAERTSARVESGRLFNVVHEYGMLQLAQPGDEAFSYLHYISTGASIDPSQWSWHTWVEQEKLLKVVYLVFLLDATLNLCFNCALQFDAPEIKLPLLCDDAAWEANSPGLCAQALGLHGIEAQMAVNTSGSLQHKQIEMHIAMTALYDTSVAALPRTTDVCSKFNLTHALHTRPGKFSGNVL